MIFPIPIIFLTARTDTESIVKGFELGAVETASLNSGTIMTITGYNYDTGLSNRSSNAFSGCTSSAIVIT